MTTNRLSAYVVLIVLIFWGLYFIWPKYKIYDNYHGVYKINEITGKVYTLNTR